MSTGDTKFVFVKDPAIKVKRRRACDTCRQRRRRCDGNEQCVHCIEHNLTCTYSKSAQKKGAVTVKEPRKAATDLDYIEILKIRLQQAETNLKYSCKTSIVLKLTKTLEIPFAPDPEDSLTPDQFAESFRSLSLEKPPGFQGQSSHAVLIKAAVSEKPQVRALPETGGRLWQKPWAKPWIMKPWHHHSTPFPDFPDDHLLKTLVSLYFTHFNSFLPLLNHPCFQYYIDDRRHMMDRSFATTLLLVCAIGSLYLPDAEDRKRLAWKWFNQTKLCGHSLHMKATTGDIQSYCLAAYFMSCTSNPRNAWSLIGFGIYLAQDIGAHRRKPSEPGITPDEEMEKRALWALVILEGQLNASLGRSPILDPTEIHVNLPSYIDGDNRHDLAFFNCLIKLYRIQSIILRFLYSSTVAPIRGQFADIRPVIDARPAVPPLQTTLNEWLASIPKRLHWDPDHLDGVGLDQSATLHCLYHHTRILIHRPFIPAMRSIPLTSPTTPICLSAARECIRIADIHRKRRPNSPPVFSQNPLFESAMVLLLEMWGQEIAEYMPNINTALDVLKSHSEHSHPSAEFYIDVLERLLEGEDDLGSTTLFESSPDSQDSGPAPTPETAPAIFSLSL
ncbi:fungal-specific transcription factor domain-containing protein [Roridomyces roridus]|uniref:Fungal-specific transcription factor domain-containing protein n=1 Tax=Roridomyces roridus TaxID=1738132 RepID=A0AAD7BYL8_9AGAR|nr:fungal-specific transcription factor domain-containing protein [Roridomyces roridus]KAJ7634427.1 fungal-specific transcription factor domain-containing protein [Roridomyces roridus]